MRHYRRQSPAARDAMLERRATELGPRTAQCDDNRQAGRLLLEVNGQRIDIELQPDPRDVRMWRAYRGGQPWMRCGLERIWRAVQADLLPCVGRRHWT
jgi:hypothetical protein